MADSFVQLNNDGPGKKIDTRTESTNGDHRQVMVIGDPTTNANVANVTAAGGVQVDGSGVTQPVSAISLPLPTGAATSANQSTTQSTLSSILANTPATGQAVMASSSPVVIASNQSSVPVTLSGNVTVVQPTGTNLHTVLDSGTTVVTQSTGTNLHTVIDSGTITLSGTSPISGTVTANQGAANILANGWPVELSDGTNLLGVTAHPIRIDPTGTTTQPISGAVTQSGTWTVQPGNTANTTPWLATINQGGNSATVNATNELLTTDTDLTNAQGSTTSGQLGPLVMGAVTTTAPTYVTAQTNPLSLTTTGALRTDASATTQPVSGTVTANQGTANATPWNDNVAQIAGTATSTAAAGVQKVGVSGATAASLDAVITAATAPANGLAILTVAQTSAPSLTAGQSVAVQCDYQGSAFVKPYRRGQTTSKVTTIAASTTATTVLAAQAAGIFADISCLWISAIPAATATVFTCTLSDGTNSYIFDMDTGTTAGAAGQGVNISFNPPLPATTAATAWTVANSSATPTTHINVVAVLQKAS